MALKRCATCCIPENLTEFPLASSLATLVLFSALMFGLSFIMVNRRTTKPAA